MNKRDCLHNIKRIAEDMAALEKECKHLKGIRAQYICNKLKDLHTALEATMNEVLQLNERG